MFVDLQSIQSVKLDEINKVCNAFNKRNIENNFKDDFSAKAHALLKIDFQGG